MKNHYNCIYLYINKINGHKYVGQAKNFNNRHYGHISESKRKHRKEYNYPFNNAIRKYGIENFEIIILKEDLSTQCLMNFWECYYIEKYNCLTKNNYNISSGGSNGNPLEGKTEEEIMEWKRKIGEKSKQYWENKTEEEMKEFSKKMSKMNKGKILSDEHKQRIKENHANVKGENHPMYNKHHSETAKQKISDNHADFGGSKNPKAKKVSQYDMNGNLIKIWDYIGQASKELGINRIGITNCCRGKSKSSGGFIWKYYKED